MTQRPTKTGAATGRIRETVGDGRERAVFTFRFQPSFFAVIAQMLAQYGLTREEGNWRRVII